MVAPATRAGREAHALCLRMQIHRLQHRAAEIVLLKQMPEVQHGRFIRHRSRAEVYAREPAQRRRLGKRLLHTGVRQVEPLLR